MQGDRESLTLLYFMVLLPSHSTGITENLMVGWHGSRCYSGYQDE